MGKFGFTITDNNGLTYSDSIEARSEWDVIRAIGNRMQVFTNTTPPTFAVPQIDQNHPRLIIILERLNDGR